MTGTAVGAGGPLRSRDAAGRRMAARLRALEGLATEILGQLDLEATLLSVINAAVDLLGADIAGIMLVEEDGVLRMRACRGHRTVHSARLVARRGQGVAGKVFESGTPCRVDDYTADPSISAHFREIVEREGTRSALGAPMAVRGRVIGTVMAWSRRPVAFGAAEEDVLVGLANLAAIAIENARLYETERRAVQTLEEANRRLEEQYALLQRATTVHERLTGLVLSGAGLSDLVSTVATHLGGEAVILDPDLAVLATTPGGETTAARARAHLEHKRRLTDPAAPSALLEPAGKWADWLLIRPVAAGGDRLGHLCVSLDHDPENLDPVIVEQAAIVCALELTKQRAVLEAHTRVRSDFIWDLLDGNVADDAEAMVRARYLGYASPLRLRVAFISVDGFTAWVRESGADADSVHHRWDAIIRAVERIAGEHSPARPLAARRGSVIALVVACVSPRGRDQQPEAAGEVVAARRLVEAVLDGLREAHPDLRFAAGVSACCALAGDLRQAGSQAASALASVSVMTPGRPVALFDDLGVVRFLLAPGDRGELFAFAHAVLGPVLDYDARHSAELVDTVDAYLAADCSLVRAAERLRVHPKTVRYRLDRAEALAERDLSRQQDRFDVQLAITIIRALSLGNAGGE